MVWYKPGRYSSAHDKMSSGVKFDRCALIASRSSVDIGSVRGLERCEMELMVVSSNKIDDKMSSEE